MRARDANAARPFRQGAVMGLTMAEAFVLIAFALLLLLALWSVEEQARDERLAPLEDLSEAQVEEAARLAAAMTPGTDDPWRLIDSDELRRVVDGLEALPPDLQADLADLVEIEDGAALARLLALSRRAEGESTRLASIGATLEEAREGRAALVASLREALGPQVAAVGGTIEADGSVVLPDAVLFEQGSATVTPLMTGFLDGFCEPWLARLAASPAPVAAARVEGHASSEWRGDTRPDEAYLLNLALSQARAQGVLDACLRRAAAPELRAWAQGHLAAVGYSSGRPVLERGEEDRERSRRVVFSVATDDGALLREVEDAALPTAP